MNVPDRCPDCRHPTSVARSQPPLLWSESGLERVVLHGAWQSQCRTCELTWVSIRGLSALCRALVQRLVWQAPRLRLGEVTFLRKTTGWSGQEFAAQMHTSGATVSRWLHETSLSTLQRTFTGTAEVLFRLLVAQRSLEAADVWGLLRPEATARLASEPAESSPWMRADMGGLGEGELPTWEVTDAADEGAAWAVRPPAPPAPPPPPPASPPETAPEEADPAPAPEADAQPAAPPMSVAHLEPPVDDAARQTDWQVRLTPREAKQAASLPERALQALARLMRRIEEAGPVRGDWPNYATFDDKAGHHHCHLVKSRPTYVACWRRPDPKERAIEIHYVGTHEKAPY